jgi:thiol-disulfide isomerase/thioredoxin/outer membrane lipoprotein-sorting protein
MKLINTNHCLFAGIAVIFLAAGPFSTQSAMAQLDPATLVGQVRTNITNSKTIQFDMNMVMDFQDGENKANAAITGRFVLGEGSNIVIRLISDDQELKVYNNNQKQYLYAVNEKTYRELSPETDRIELIKSILRGPLETPFSFLADFLHGTEFSFEQPPVYGGAEEIEGVVHHAVDMLFPQCSTRAFLSITDPSLLRGFVMKFRGATLAKYARTANASLSITADLTNWKFDELLPESTFAFTPPPGVTPEKEASAAAPDALVGQEAPAFTLPTLEGGVVSLSQHRDKDIVILDFWASWCGPCRQAMPIVSAVANKFKDKNVVLYAVNLRETPDKVRGFLQSSGLSVNVLLDKGDVGGKYGVTGIPRLVIIGKDGLIKTVHSGMSPTLETQITEEIKALL